MFCWNLFIFFFFSSRNLRAPSADRREILHDARSCVQFYNAVQNSRGASPKKFYAPKTCKIWPNFRRLQSSAANISGRDKNIQSR